MYREAINLRKVLRVVRTPSNLCCIGQGLPGSLPWGVILTYLNDYLAQEQQLNINVAASVRWPPPPVVWCRIDGGWSLLRPPGMLHALLTAAVVWRAGHNGRWCGACKA